MKSISAIRSTPTFVFVSVSVGMFDRFPPNSPFQILHCMIWPVFD